MKKNVLVVGLGLLGTSLAMALKERNFYHVQGHTRRREIIEWAIRQGILEDDSLQDITSLLKSADIVILSLPTLATTEFIAEYADKFSPNSIVTDIGSTKQSFMLAGEKYLRPRNIAYVGSHPMAGTEKSGPFNAFKTLFENADVFICGDDLKNSTAAAEISALWQSINCRTTEITTENHDKLVAKTSHVAHILASALTVSVLDYGDKNSNFRGCASGFRDTSRTASSDPKMWREIVELNKNAVLEALDKFEFEYSKFRKAIENENFDDFEKEFAKGKTLRAEWLEYMANKEK